ncbi:MAG: hypothetical protein H6737_28975 [Alphaproteobacteria bacterium]|nr:hypothetical protein [Alphaproteobacteria bacterium]
MSDDDPNDEQPGAEPGSFAPEPSYPPMEAPALERLNLKGAKVRETSPPLAGYVAHEEVAGTPFLRDNPFSDNTPGIFGGETPFFQSEAPAFDFEMEDTDGIPTGLPNLLDLPELEVWVPRQTDVLPDPSGPVMAEVLGVDGVKEAVEEAEARHAVAVSGLEKKHARELRVAFSVGVIVTSLLWGILLLALSLQAE